MSKEFNIDNYRYTEDVIQFSDWLHGYKPQPNHLNPRARLSGLLYEHQGAEWDHIQQLPVYEFWTVYREDGVLKIRNGYQVRGRIGYVVAKTGHNAHATILVNGLTEEMLEHRLGSEEL